jgi:hypothetical protein
MTPADLADLDDTALAHGRTLLRAIETPPELAGDEFSHLVEAAAWPCASSLAEARAGLEGLLLGLAARNSADPAADHS